MNFVKNERIYACIDLKSFYASVECAERGLDPLKARLVVADETRTDGTICLAVSPALKEEGVSGRPRLFQVKQMTRDFLIAPPRMRLYMEYSARIYNIYLDFVSEEDILVYSIDEVFIDLTDYVRFYGVGAEELVRRMIEAVHAATGITATAGVGTNMYLAKVAMDIEAKKMAPGKLGVRLASLDERSYRERLWGHRPLTDFWRVGPGYARKLEAHGMRTMGDVARASIESEDLLFQLFGVNAEFLIDHAWGQEPCTLAEAKAYRPAKHSISRGQVLHGFYDFRRAEVIVREMAEELTLKMVDKGVAARQFVLWVTYTEEEKGLGGRKELRGQAREAANFGREKRKHARATINFDHYTASTTAVMQRATKAYLEMKLEGKRMRKIGLSAEDVMSEAEAAERNLVSAEQVDLFGEYWRRAEQRERGLVLEQREHRMQEAMLAIKKRYGKNAILRAMDFEEGATARERNLEVGGHKG